MNIRVSEEKRRREEKEEIAARDLWKAATVLMDICTADVHPPKGGRFFFANAEVRSTRRSRSGSAAASGGVVVRSWAERRWITLPTNVNLARQRIRRG
jgi:hypothetical protein